MLAPESLSRAIWEPELSLLSGTKRKLEFEHAKGSLWRKAADRDRRYGWRKRVSRCPLDGWLYCHATFPAMTSFRGTAEVTHTLITVWSKNFRPPHVTSCHRVIFRGRTGGAARQTKKAAT